MDKIRRLFSLRWGDFIVFAVVVVVGVLPFALRRSEDARRFVVVVGGRVVAAVPANADTTIVVDAPLGDVVVSISGGAARIVSSSCPKKLCVKAGEISRAGQVIVCVPNGLFVAAEGRCRYDAILR